MSMTPEVKNSMLDSGYGTGASSGTYMSLHTADPTATATTAAANEMTGGSPAYAAKQLNLNAAATSQKTLAAAPVFDIPPGVAFSHYGLWNHPTLRAQANYKGGAALAAPESAYGSQGTYTVSALTVSLT